MAGIKLHIGGTEPRAGWSILNVAAAPYVDYVADCRDLSSFADGSCAEIYASHVLEHLKHRNELLSVLKQLHRILEPGGRLRASVPDLDILCRLFIAPGLKPKQRFLIMAMMFGGQLDAHDIHYCGLTHEFLKGFLLDAGFQRIGRVAEFDEFADASHVRIGDVPISLNIEAYK